MLFNRQVSKKILSVLADIEVILIVSVIFYLLAILSGILFPIQGAVNGLLKNELGNPFLSGAMSNFVGMLIMLSVSFLSKNIFHITLPEFTINKWYIWIGGGMISALIVSVNVVAPRVIGFANFLSVYLVSQLVMSIIIDYKGLFNAELKPFNQDTVIGLVLLFIGIYFLVYKTNCI